MAAFKKTLASVAAVTALGVAAMPAAQANDRAGAVIAGAVVGAVIGGILLQNAHAHGPAPVVVAPPAPVVYAPPPPVYRQAPVVYAPPPVRVIYRPAPVYVEPRWHHGHHGHPGHHGHDNPGYYGRGSW